MCIYKRLLFSACNHSQWSPTPLRICAVQQAFLASSPSPSALASAAGDGAAEDGQQTGRPGPCKHPRGHPLATVKVQGRCERCRGSREDVAAKLARARDLISESKQTLIGADERCRAILEDAGLEVGDGGSGSGSGSSDEDDPAEVERLREEMEELAVGTAGGGKGGGDVRRRNNSVLKDRGGVKGGGGGQARQGPDQGDPVVEFLKRRKQEKNAGLFM
ncbi:hypothetical protein JX265_006256 [Neoarthrinium moseri]|uniref:Uncharacterized protein n=1 Tax=Neoarthrinium moseri TaxID=1658444 RepID=A0A9P9WM73_9PEZI|nr:uncharacterized protein JN550_011985 [Neoarthrinium moseri]KAI1859577.1 hypothetical protein JN550_011985 [Neoarthrinium moseri]KAI1870086.1 hypothetical protein JX265_006256 [Neoarthrinium moseri]